MRLHAAGGPGAADRLSSTVQSQENDMTELVMTTEAEVEDFTDELSDEALDRAEGGSIGCACSR
jgi:phage-related minor tail protein